MQRSRVLTALICVLLVAGRPAWAQDESEPAVGLYETILLTPAGDAALIWGERRYAGRLEVRIVDVFEDRASTERHGIRIIPTQVFFGPGGQELFRHEGVISKDLIVAKWKELGHDLSQARQAAPKR